MAKDLRLAMAKAFFLMRERADPPRRSPLGASAGEDALKNNSEGSLIVEALLRKRGKADF